MSRKDTTMREIRLDHVSKTYGKAKVLDDVSVSFEYGKIYGLLGRNGAGKSTLLGVIANRLFPSSGQILIDGEVATENAAVLTEVHGTTELGLYPADMGTGTLFKSLGKLRSDFDVSRATFLAEMFELDVKKPLYKLSTGYRTIYQLIIAFSLNVSYLLLDEPVLGLDANHRELFYKLLLEDYLERGRTVVVATHLIEEVANLVERVVVLDHGRVLLEASADELRERGYNISGRNDDVRTYCDGLDVIGVEELGGLAVAYLMGEPESMRLTDRLTVAPLNLQKLFVKMTENSTDRED